jgi:hypothetical protein
MDYVHTISHMYGQGFLSVGENISPAGEGWGKVEDLTQ